MKESAEKTLKGQSRITRKKWWETRTRINGRISGKYFPEVGQVQKEVLWFMKI